MGPQPVSRFWNCIYLTSIIQNTAVAQRFSQGSLKTLAAPPKNKWLRGNSCQEGLELDISENPAACMAQRFSGESLNTLAVHNNKHIFWRQCCWRAPLRSPPNHVIFCICCCALAVLSTQTYTLCFSFHSCFRSFRFRVIKFVKRTISQLRCNAGPEEEI